VSSDGGRSFARFPSTGMLGLACNATATSAMTLWGFCATGSLGYPVRSVDGGRAFARLSGWKYEASNGGSSLSAHLGTVSRPPSFCTLGAEDFQPLEFGDEFA
jgi:hypothetical protein